MVPEIDFVQGDPDLLAAFAEYQQYADPRGLVIRFGDAHLRITTEHPNSHYGIPVVLLNGREVAATDTTPAINAILGGNHTYGDWAQLMISDARVMPETKRSLALWLNQWGIEPAAFIPGL